MDGGGLPVLPSRGLGALAAIPLMQAQAGQCFGIFAGMTSLTPWVAAAAPAGDGMPVPPSVEGNCRLGMVVLFTVGSRGFA